MGPTVGAPDQGSRLPPHAISTSEHGRPVRFDKLSGIPFLAARIRFRSWQIEALSKLDARVHSSFLAVATPGAGKTTFALAAIHQALVARTMRRVVVVVPTQHLKLQWALAAEKFDIHLDPEWSASDGTLPSDVHGVAVTYQQVAANPAALRRLVRQAFVVLDEVHHAADARSWGDGIRTAFEKAPLRLCLSGTPFRSDQSAIPFVRYAGEEAQPDYEYGYGEALIDPPGCSRRVLPAHQRTHGVDVARWLQPFRELRRPDWSNPG